MKYTLDTLPVLDAYRENCECPLCRLRISCEDQYVDSMLGAAYMEPECRIKTNETGFCTRKSSKTSGVFLKTAAFPKVFSLHSVAGKIPIRTAIRFVRAFPDA